MKKTPNGLKLVNKKKKTKIAKPLQPPSRVILRLQKYIYKKHRAKAKTTSISRTFLQGVKLWS